MTTIEEPEDRVRTLAEDMIDPMSHDNLERLKYLLIDMVYIYETRDIRSIVDDFVVEKLYVDDSQVSKNILLIQGDAGTGKSIMMRETENRFWRKETFTQSGQLIIPLLVILSEIKETDRCLQEALKRYGFDDMLIETILDKGKKNERGSSEYFFLVLFDGYDELRKPVNLYEQNRLQDYECKVIFSSR